MVKIRLQRVGKKKAPFYHVVVADSKSPRDGKIIEQIGTYKKNRYDHRHHALDACVIALIDRSLVKEIATKNARRQKNRIEFPAMPILRSELIEKTKNIVVSHKPDHGAQGKLSKETLLGKVKCSELIDEAIKAGTKAQAPGNPITL